MNVEPAVSNDDPELEEELDHVFHSGVPDRGGSDVTIISPVVPKVGPHSSGASQGGSHPVGGGPAPGSSGGPVDNGSGGRTGDGGSRIPSPQSCVPAACVPVPCNPVPCISGPRHPCHPVACQPVPCRPDACDTAARSPAVCPPPSSCPESPVSCGPAVDSSVAVAALAGGVVALVVALAVVGLVVVLRYAWPLLLLLSAAVLLTILFLPRRRSRNLQRLRGWVTAVGHLLFQRLLPGWLSPIPEVRIY